MTFLIFENILVNKLRQKGALCDNLYPHKDSEKLCDSLSPACCFSSRGLGAAQQVVEMREKKIFLCSPLFKCIERSSLSHLRDLSSA